MDRINRRQVVRGAAAAAVTLTAPSAYAQNDRQTLRFVAEADLKILDPTPGDTFLLPDGEAVREVLGSRSTARTYPRSDDVSPRASKFCDNIVSQELEIPVPARY
jgi:hypothetical protein